MAPRTIEVTRDQLVARRTATLRALGITLAELRERARTGTLSGDEWDAIEDLEEVGFLLGDATDDF